jgi:hypothetical protein
MVEYREDVGLQDAGLGEGRFDDQDGGVGEVGFAFRVTPDVAGETEIRQVVQGFPVNHSCAAKEFQLSLAEAEGRDALQEAAGAADNPVAPAVGQPAGEGLKDGFAVRGAGMERGLQHGQFVVISEQGRAWLVPAGVGTHKITLVRIPIEWTDDLKRCARP